MDSTTFRLNLAKTYINAMEILVEEEVTLRLEQLSESHRPYLNRMEMIAHALNQLPVLYATGERGLDHQLQQGRNHHGAHIKQSVQTALATVLYKPILNYVPINQEAPAALRPVLKRIQVLLQNRKVNWENLPDILDNLTQHISEADLLAIVNAIYPTSIPVSYSHTIKHGDAHSPAQIEAVCGTSQLNNPDQNSAQGG